MSKTLTTEEVLVALAAGKTLERDDSFSGKPLQIMLIDGTLWWKLTGSVVINPWRQITEEAWHLAPKKVTYKMWLVLHSDGTYSRYYSKQRAEECLSQGAELREITWEVEVDDV